MSEERLTALYRTYGPCIYARCLRILRDAAAAEDATQETFVRVHRHLDKAPDSDQALRWIYRIATNYCLNELRRRKSMPEPREVLPEHATHVASVEQLLADRDLVARMIARAPEKVRVVVWLHHVDGLDQGEVAEVLGVSRRTVVNRLADFAALAERLVRKTA
jgi:RNA polymerase sigma-70 factor (ECF subfamily)